MLGSKDHFMELLCAKHVFVLQTLVCQIAFMIVSPKVSENIFNDIVILHDADSSHNGISGQTDSEDFSSSSELR